MTLVIIHCNNLTVIMLNMYKAAAVLSALMKVCTIHCHDSGHSNVMLVLQNCIDPLHILRGSSGVSHATSSDGACNFSNVEVEEDVDVIEEGFIAVNEEADIGIKQEEIPEDINFPDIKYEPVEVSYVCVCVCVLLDTIYQCAAISVFLTHMLGIREHKRYVQCYETVNDQCTANHSSDKRQRR